MYAEYLGGDDGSNWETVKYVDKRLPYLDVTPSFAFVVKAIYF